MEELKQRWRLASCGPLHQSPTITDEGLVLGYGTVLVGRSQTGFDLDSDAGRATCLLAIAGRRAPSVNTMDGFRRAFACWDRNDRCLAQIHIAFTKPARAEHANDAWRLFLADHLLGAGMAPDVLLKALDLDSIPQTFSKYDPDQPRESAGSGQTSGRWAKNPGAGQAASSKTSAARGTLLAARAPSLLDTLGGGAIEWLSRLAARAALPAALFGALFIPAPNGLVTEGDVPGRPGLRYRLDRDTGTLRITTDGDPTHAIVGHLGPGGLYHDAETGEPIARAIDGAVILDPDRLPEGSKNAAPPYDEPKLCPDPKEDRKGGRKLFDELYEQYVRDHNNPQRQPQLPPGLTFALPKPDGSGWVHFDDCRESDGTMIEAKGNYASMMAKPFMAERLKKRWVNQAIRQIEASQGRHLAWYFHDPAGASAAKDAFSSNAKIGDKITVYVLPYPGGVPNPNPRIK